MKLDCDLEQATADLQVWTMGRCVSADGFELSRSSVIFHMIRRRCMFVSSHPWALFRRMDHAVSCATY
jgi:hypothetical protein